MDDYVDDFALRVMRYNKYARTKRTVEKTMQRYGMTRPLTVECRKLLNDLPNEPSKRKGDDFNVISFEYRYYNTFARMYELDEVLRRCFKFPKTEHEVAQTLNNLYVYSDVGNSLGSDAITHAVLKTLKIIEGEIPPPEKTKVSPGNKNTRRNRPKHDTIWDLEERLSEDICKYSRVGEIKRRLYSMPEYVSNRDRKGIKLPDAKLRSPSLHMNLNISKVRGSNTKMGNVIVQQEVKRKKMEDLRHQLNPYAEKSLQQLQ